MSGLFKSFQDLIKEYWENHLSEYPLGATMTGDHRFNDKIEGFSEQDFERRLLNLKGFQSRLQQIDHDEFPKADKINYDIFQRILKREIESIQFKSYRMTISKIMNFTAYQFNPSSYLRAPFNSFQDYKNYISRLNLFPRLVDENIELLKNGIKDGQIQSRITLEGVVKSFRGYLVKDPEDSVYFSPFSQFKGKISGDAKTQLITLGKEAIIDKVIPSLLKFADFLESEYIPATREDISAQNLPNGEQFYKHCIHYHTSLDWSPEKIHEIGMEEVKRIKNEMEDIVKETKFKGSIKDFVEFLRTDPQFYATSPEQLLEKTALILKRMDGKLPSIFKTLPRLPYGLKAIPNNIAPGTTTAFYQPGTGDGTQAGNYFVNTYDLKSRPLYEIEALSLHEAVPGHHLQIALQQELELPAFRRFKRFSSFVEGWGLYTERLGLEIGFYKDPYSNFGRLSYEMWRATRLVVDTGIHALGWSRQQAIDFMQEYTSLSLLNITNEIDRYIAWPGQALAYKLGEIKIRELRKKAEKSLGTKFDLREFHDSVLLNGSLPLDLLENIVNEWIREKLHNN